MPVDIIPYVPTIRAALKVADVPSAWRGLEEVLIDIVIRFNVDIGKALEFGVEHGFSASALASIFRTVRGVDSFMGDQHSGFHEDEFKQSRDRLKDFPNVELIQARYEDFILFDESRYGLIHVDIVHSYIDTYNCGNWAVKHAPVTLFHDTQSFPEVKQAVADIAWDNGLRFYNYEPCHGLGILVRES